MNDRYKRERYGLHFNEEKAKEAVSNMRNEDGTTGEHWDINETTRLAELFGVDLYHEYNKYDWYVALNMIRSDYYKVITNMANSDHPKYFVEFAKAWLNDKDVPEGKMYKYYKHVILDDCDDYEEEPVYRRERNRYDEYEYRPSYERKSRY